MSSDDKIKHANGRDDAPENADDREVERKPSRSVSRDRRDDERRKRSRTRSRTRSRSRRRDRSRSRGDRDRSRDRDRRSRRDRDRRDDRDRDRRPTRDYDRDYDRRDRDRRGDRGGPRNDRGPPRRNVVERDTTPPAEREMRRLDRDTRTVFAYNLNLRAEEKELFQFFVNAGPISDIKIIRDKTTTRSKGFAYIEFEHKDSVIRALALTGQLLMGQSVMVKMSEAEKNVAWAAAAEQKAQQKLIEQQYGPGGAAALALGAFPNLAQAAAVPTGPTKLAVANIHPSITEPDIQPIFQPFCSPEGGITSVVIQRDASGQSLGTAVIEFMLGADALQAMEQLNNFDLVGLKLKIQIIPPGGFPPPAAGAGGPGVTAAAAVALQGMQGINLNFQQQFQQQQQEEQLRVGGLDERLDVDGATDGGGLRLTAQTRAALMSRLAANAGMEVPQMPQYGMPQQQPVGGGGVGVAGDLTLEQGVLGPASPIPTQCVLLKNMFDPAEETAPEWDQDIAQDVREECSKYGGVDFVHVDRDSKGFVYVKFNDTQAASVAHKALHGRWFAGKQIVAEYQFTTLFNSHFML